MKKITTLLLLACIFVTGCDKDSLKDAQLNLVTAKNYTANVVLNIRGTFDSEKINFIRRKKVLIDNINGTAKINADITQNKETSSETYYIKTDKDNATTYKKQDGIYNATTEKKDQNSLYYITAFINENSEILRKEEKNNLINYVINLKKDRVESFLSSYYDVAFLNNEKFTIIDDVPLYLEIDKKGNIKSIEADFSNSIKYNNVKNYELEKFKLVIKYDSFNETKEVKIPNQILENSFDEKLLSIRRYAIDYVKGVNELKLGNTTTTNTIGYTIDSANLTIVDDNVDNGTIIIDGYNIEVKDGKIGVPTIDE